MSEAVATLATNVWFNQQPVVISTTLIFICIVMMRWNGFAIIPALLGGLVYCIVTKAPAQEYAIYIAGNCMTLLSLLWFKIFNKEDIKNQPIKLVLFVASSFLLLWTGRWLISLMFGGGLASIIGYIGKDSISLLFAVVVMLLMRNADGMIEDQKAYLFRQQREREQRRNEGDYSDYN